MNFKGHRITKASNGKFFIYGPKGRMITGTLQAAKTWISSKNKLHKKKKRVLNPGDTQKIKDYAGFSRKDKIHVGKINIPNIKSLIEIGEAFAVAYKSDKFSKGSPKYYEHKLRKHGRIFLVNSTRNASTILITGLKLNMKPEGLTG